jgi:hypothetical protein
LVLCQDLRLRGLGFLNIIIFLIYIIIFIIVESINIKHVAGGAMSSGDGGGSYRAS